MTFVRPEQSRSPSLRDAPDSATRNNKRVADNPAVLAALLGLWGTRGSSQGSLESTAHVLPGAFVNGKAAAVGLSRQSIAESNLPRDDRGALSRAAGGYVPPDDVDNKAITRERRSGAAGLEGLTSAIKSRHPDVERGSPAPQRKRRSPLTIPQIPITSRPASQLDIHELPVGAGTSYSAGLIHHPRGDAGELLMGTSSSRGGIEGWSSCRGKQRDASASDESRRVLLCSSKVPENPDDDRALEEVDNGSRSCGLEDKSSEATQQELGVGAAKSRGVLPNLACHGRGDEQRTAGY